MLLRSIRYNKLKHIIKYKYCSWDTLKFYSHFPVPFVAEPVKAPRSLSLSWPMSSHVVCGLCRPLLPMGQAVLLWSGIVCSCLSLCFFVHYSELPVNTEALSIVLLRRLCFPPALFSECVSAAGSSLLGPGFFLRCVVLLLSVF